MEILLRDEVFIPTYDDLQLQDQCSYFIDEIVELFAMLISFLCLLKGIWNTKVDIKILNEMTIKRKMEKSKSNTSTFHVQNQFHNLQNCSIDLSIIVDPMAIARLLKDIKLHYHVVTMKEKKQEKLKHS
jgi:hypothetical protein